MKKNKKREKLSSLFSEISVPHFSESHIEIHGMRELLLSGCKGIMDYSPLKILISTVNGNVTLTGSGLKLSVFRDDILSVSGKIEAVSFTREDIRQ